MDFKSAEDLVERLSLETKVEATRKLTRYYTDVRFKTSDEDFVRQYTDGGDDGGIDFYHHMDGTFIVAQTKFASKPRRSGISEIRHEIDKLKTTLAGKCTNRRAESFVNELRREAKNEEALLEVLWLTTNEVEESTRNQAQRDLNSWKRNIGWKADIDFIPIDRHAINGLIYDKAYGYIPHTGRQTLRLGDGEWMKGPSQETGVFSLVATVAVNDILKWFNSFDDIKNFLQKNVRGFIGEAGKVNKKIPDSYLTAADWFWYKHNGIVIFADSISIDEENSEAILRNPQIVNGGQTISAIFMAYDRHGRAENSARVLLRAYRLSYDDTETYRRSIEIVRALNSQNKINESDLRTMDARQVRLETLFDKFGYKYLRKRSKDAKASRRSVTMRNLALRYRVCAKNAPHLGVTGDIDTLFEQDTKYDEVFDESAIRKDVGLGHVVVSYLTVWNIDQIVQKLELPKLDRVNRQQTRWFVLADAYGKLRDWRTRKFDGGAKLWIDFLESPEFEKALSQYCWYAFPMVRKMLPKREQPRKFLASPEASKKFANKTSYRKLRGLMNRAYKRHQDRRN